MRVGAVCVGVIGAGLAATRATRGHLTQNTASGRAIAAGVEQQERARKKPRNVLLITIDTLRADHVSGYGYARPTTPNLDRLMAGGTRFEWAFSTSSCTVPSHTSILTGLFPSSTSVGFENGRKWALDLKVTTLAEICRQAGMYTGAVVSSHTLIRKVGLDQGFVHYDDRVSDRRASGKQPADWACGKALKRLKKQGDQPFFFWLHLMDPHGPYVPPPQWLERFPPIEEAERIVHPPLVPGDDPSGYGAIPSYQVYKDETGYEAYVRRYDAEIAFMDDELGKFFAELERRDLLQETLVVVTSDHGEAMGEDNFYFAHSHSVGLDQVRVPLAFFGAGVKPGRVIHQPVSNMDVFPTVCQMLGLEAPAGVDSRSLAGCLAGLAEPGARPVLCGALSQWGAALGNLYFRRDRRPATDRAFWRKNVNSNGPHRPCGAQLVRLSDGKRLPLAQGAEVRAALDRFVREAEVALKQTPRTRRVNRSAAEIRTLSRIGYLAGDDETPVRRPKRHGGRTRPASSRPQASGSGFRVPGSGLRVPGSGSAILDPGCGQASRAVLRPGNRGRGRPGSQASSRKPQAAGREPCP